MTERLRIGMSRIVLGPSGVLLAIFGFVYLQKDLVAYPLAEAAGIIERSRRLPSAGDDRQTALQTAAAAVRGCRLDETRSRVTVTLFLLNRAAADGRDVDVRGERFEAGQAALRAALGCDPSNGQFWALLAAMEGLAAFEPVRYAKLMEMSVRSASFEYGALSARWSAMASLPDLGKLLANETLRDDFRRSLDMLPPAIVVSVLDRVPATSRSTLLAPLIEGLAPRRLEELTAAARRSQAIGATDVLSSTK